jgi:hypothetical protein
MLSGHLQDAKAPGHFVGKGWLQLEFDRIILPGAEVLPLQAKIIAAPHLKADRDGEIHGRGHPKRDAVEWMIPVMWPIKVLTLPARGPYPALKGEARLTMRLMEDVEVPVNVAQSSAVAPPWWTPSNTAPTSYGVHPASMVTHDVALAPIQASANANATSHDPVPVIETTHLTADVAQAHSTTLLALRGGAAFVALDYWVEGGRMHCVSQSGQARVFPLESLDLNQTVQLNRERNVDFVLHTRDTVNEQ